MRTAENLSIPPGQNKDEARTPAWRWAGYYPIMDEPREAFFLPYFHRTVEDYRSALEGSGFIIERILEFPDSKQIPSLLKRGISPFAPFKNNLYWPRIGEAPSSLAFITHKGTNP